MGVLTTILRVARAPAVRFWGLIALLLCVQWMAWGLIAIPDMGVRTVLAHPYAFAVGLMLALASFWLIALFRTLLSLRTVKWREDLPREFCAIALTMGVANKIRRFGVMPDWSNAAAVGGDQVVVGERLLADHRADTVIGVVAHEFAHVRRFCSPRWWILFIVAFVPLAVLCWLWRGYPPVILWPVLVSAIGLSAMAFHWLEETGADDVAADFVGAENVADALADIRQRTVREDGPSLTHPSLANRIHRLRRRASAELAQNPPTPH